MADLLGIGVAGVRINQQALAVTGQNITNANTPGYSRQRVEVIAQVGSGSASTFSGAGARVDSIQRIADDYRIRQVRSDQTNFSDVDAFATRMEQIEGLFFGEGAGIDEAMTAFFDALHSANARPASLPDRQIVLNEAESLVQRFNSVHQRILEQEKGVNELLDSSVNRVNELATSLGSINERLAGLDQTQKGGVANTLIDQRDELLRELAEHVRVNTVEAGLGQLNIFIGKGLPLVLGSEPAQLEVTGDAEISLRTEKGAPSQIITSSIAGGDLGGMLRFRDTTLREAGNALGRIAAALAQTVNNAHGEGLDLRGAFGGLFFGDVNAAALTRDRAVPQVGNRESPNSALDVLIESPDRLTGSDYELVFADKVPGAWTVHRRNGGEIVAQGVLNGSDSQDIAFEGIRIRLTGANFNPGNRYSIEPTRNMAGALSLAIEDPARLALAAPIRLDAAPDNAGSGGLVLKSVDDRSHPFFQPGSLVPPLKIVFTSATTYDVMDNTDPSSPRHFIPPLRSLSYVPGSSRPSLPSDGDRLVSMQGSAVGALPLEPSITPDLGTGGNRYSAGSVEVAYRDPITGAPVQNQSVAWGPSASAREIAHALGALSGVQARAVTELDVTGISTNNTNTSMVLVINGQSFTEPTSLNKLADDINANPNLAKNGITARSDGTRLRLTDVHGNDIKLHVAGDPTDAITVQDSRGRSLVVNGAGPTGYKHVSVGGVVTTQLAQGVSLKGDGLGLFTTDPAHADTGFGFRLSITGQPEAGDEFSVSFNHDATSDNRNGLVLAGFSAATVLGDPPVSFGEAYALIVQDVGNVQSEADVQREAAEVLLDQSVAARDSVSGVNLDEEAANLIRFEQAYNASAQIIAAARQIFDTLLDAVR